MKIAIVTGAGVSAESGISTFRDEDGLWTKYRVEDVATTRALHHHPEQVIEFFNMLRREMNGKQPNAAHYAIGELEKKHEVTVITQNVDDLHERGGSTNVIHVHGSLFQARDWDTGEIVEKLDDITPDEHLRPNVVLFGEFPLDEDRALDALYECDIFISIGTSGDVFPVAGYIDRVNTLGKAKTVEINPYPTSISHKFDRRIKEPATEGVVKYVKELIDG
jgi:NAD-dependent deacetylase